MPHTNSLQNVPSSVAAAETRYRELLSEAAEARRFVPERTRHASGVRTLGAALRHATGVHLVRLGMWLQGAAVAEATATAPAAVSESR
jgi:hypothetical protein